MINYTIEKLKIDELKDALDVVYKTFMKFEAPEYSKEGIDNFLKFIDYDSVKEKLAINMEIYVAKVEDKIVGVIGYRDNLHINLLFVLEEYHYNGIARGLFNFVEEKLKVLGTQKITVNSSPYAYNVYLKFGFTSQLGIKEVDGIKFYPMEKEIKNI